jgi:acyl-CoA synthetase (AMP-forming)/AMP-acid ligase II
MTFTDYVFEKSKNLTTTALICEDTEISYSEIYESINFIAQLLKEGSFQTGESVLLISDNSSFFIEAYFGIIKMGGICVPVNPSTNENDIRYIVDILDIRRVFCSSKYKNSVVRILPECTKIYDESDISRSKEDVGAGELIDEKEATALIMFTSGSTSRPKGVMLTHYNLMHNTSSIIRYLELTEKDRIEVVLPFYYCYGTSLLNTHFRCGGSVVLNNNFMFPETVIDCINKYKCTGFSGVPSTYQILLRMSSFKETKMPSLRYVTQAGGRLPEVFIEEMLSSLRGVLIYVMYGQTEATARLSYLPPEKLKEKMGSVGKGIPGTELFVADKEGNRLSPFEVGEIVARGGNIMKGYFNDTEETRKVLRSGILYTGDIGFMDEEGYIFIVSREKNIIKCAGNRISPKEIENVICTISQIVECAVVGVEDDILGEAVKAFVVLKPGSCMIDGNYIKKYCMERLPGYKVPKFIKILQALPKNSSGKVLFKELRHM